MSTKYTPGPWEAVSEGHRLSVWAEGYGFIHTHEVPQVNTGATDTANANSRLIAAAPELLIACERALAALEGILSQSNFKSDVPEILRAAIAKAEGVIQ